MFGIPSLMFIIELKVSKDSKNLEFQFVRVFTTGEAKFLLQISFQETVSGSTDCSEDSSINGLLVGLSLIGSLNNIKLD